MSVVAIQFRLKQLDFVKDSGFIGKAENDSISGVPFSPKQSSPSRKLIG
jgi:hypothetical protein